jgi:hypothetical protein
MQRNPKVPLLAKIIGIVACYIEIRILLRLAHVLPQDKSMAAYPSLFQHTLLAVESVIGLLAAILLLKLWRISAALFTLRFAMEFGNGVYRGFFAPSKAILRISHTTLLVLTVVVFCIGLALVLYTWRVTAQSGWFNSNPPRYEALDSPNVSLAK